MQYPKAIAASFLIIVFLLALLLLFIASTVFLYQKKHRSFLDKLEETRLKYEQELLKSQLEVQEDTLQHLSRELHDSVAAQFTLAKLYLSTIILPSDHPSTDKFAHVIDLLTKGLEDLRDVSKSLSLDLIRSIGLRKAIESQVIQLRKSGEFKIVYDVRGACDYDDEQKEIIVFRIFQEAINNIIRHAQATTIHILLDSTTKDQLRLIVADNGKGFAAQRLVSRADNNQPGGLRNMHVRARLIDAHITITSLPDKGTTVDLSVPLATDSYLTLPDT